MDPESNALANMGSVSGTETRKPDDPPAPRRIWLWHDTNANWENDQCWRAIREDGEDLGAHVSSTREFGIQDIKHAAELALGKEGKSLDDYEVIVVPEGEWPPPEVLERGGWKNGDEAKDEKEAA